MRQLSPSTALHNSPRHPLQIVSVDARGAGIKRIRPKSLYDMLKVGGVAGCVGGSVVG